MLLTIAQVADRLQCSRGHVHNLILAQRMAEARRILPPRLRPLADVKFPRPRYLSAGNRMPRIDEQELLKWLENEMKKCPCCFHVFEDEDLIDYVVEKEKPEGCICNPREWGGDINPICQSFHPMSEEEPDICKSCEHEKGCHRE